MADANILAALSNGCTGMWGAVCEEGATCGHASTIMTLTNLARMGNKHVQRKFNLPMIRQAAINVSCEINLFCLLLIYATGD
jgi:hypothetical protein